MPRSYQQLTYEERCQISILKERGDCSSQIAKALGRHRSTITRELLRNSANGYRYEARSADIRSRKRRFYPPIKMFGELITLIEDRLKLQWSPEQIAGRLKIEFGIRISHETIYKHVWKDKRSGGLLYKHLRHSGKKYNRRSKGSAGRGCIPNRIDISERPAIVERKVRVGDWELDTSATRCY